MGVRHNPDSSSKVRGSNVCGRYAIPFRVVTDLGQVSENVSHPSNKQRCHVLHEDDSRSYHANATHHLPPQPRTGSGNPGAFPGVRYVLAGKSSGDDGLSVEASSPKSERESADPGEEVDLRVAEEVFVRDDLDVSFIDNPPREQAFFHAFAQDGGAVGVVFVVEMHRATPALETSSGGFLQFAPDSLDRLLFQSYLVRVLHGKALGQKSLRPHELSLLDHRIAQCR